MSSKFDVEFQENKMHRQEFWDRIHGHKKSILAHYYHQNISRAYKNLIPSHSSVLEIGCGSGALLASLSPSIGVGVDFSHAAINKGRNLYPNIEFVLGDAHHLDVGSRTFDYIIISELVNDVWDVQMVLQSLLQYCNASTRVVFNFYSHLWNLPLKVARKIGFATPTLSQNWLTPGDLRNLLCISQFQNLSHWQEILIPINIPLISYFANRYLAKVKPFNHLCLTNFVVARPLLLRGNKSPTVSVIVAARNEAGHIDELIARIPQMGAGTEIIFVEGNSTDDTYAVIEDRIRNQAACKLLKQPGKGKGDAVRAGFEAATGEILMILDADITVPPEDLPKFYELIANGVGEFANGVRLVYPMQNEAMRFFNLIGNKFFSWAFSYLLGQPIRDTLCGTKVLWKKDYERIKKGRSYFGDFDPFGDFDLLFGAARLNLKIIEVPIRYRARSYGETNISRWSHGWLLLKMVAFAARRIKFTWG